MSVKTFLEDRKNKQINDRNELKQAIQKDEKERAENIKKIAPVMEDIYRVFYKCHREIKSSDLECTLFAPQGTNISLPNERYTSEITLGGIEKKRHTPGKTKDIDPIAMLKIPHIKVSLAYDYTTIHFGMHNVDGQKASRQASYSPEEITEKLVDDYIETFLKSILN